MSYNGSGTFNINSTGQPVVAGTVITASAFNALTTDLATGLTTAITKDGQTTTTARITFAQGFTSSLVTDSSSVSTGSIITAGGAGIAKNLYVGVNANVAGTLGVTGVATFSAAPIYSSLTASSAVATDASKGLVSVTNTGTGNNVLATAPTIASLNLTTALTLTGASGTAGQALTSGGSGVAPTWTTISSSPTAITNGTSNVTVNSSGGSITATTNGTAAVTIDTSQNVGIGVTPSAWGGTYKAEQIGAKAAVSYTSLGNGYTLLTHNAYDSGAGAWKYIANGYASQYTEVDGTHQWTTSASGTAGNAITFTESMRIDASGNVGIGTSSPSTKLAVAGGISGTGAINISGGGWGTLPYVASSLVIDNNAGETRFFADGDASNFGTYIWYGGKTTGATSTYMTLNASGNLSVTGSLSKGSGSFRIDHPLPSLTETHQLVHSFIEAPKADLIYRGRVTLVNGVASVNIDEIATMTNGTFEALCRDIQCFTTNESDWTPVKGFVTGNILTIESQDQTATSNISWMVIGERKDKHMMETDWTDSNGKVIVEPLKT